MFTAKEVETITSEINKLKFKDDANVNYVRYTTKANCYRSIIAELTVKIKAKK